MAQITTISPITGSPIHTRTSITPSDFPQLVTTARTAFESFQSTHSALASRQSIIRKFLDLLLERKDELARDITEQMGRPIRYTNSEVETAVKRAKFMLRISGEVLKEEFSAEEDLGENERKWVSKEPYGVILVVFAWNYPWLILVNSLIPALLAGNAVIIKPSPQTPTIAESAVRLLEEAGLPKGVVQAVHCGDPETIQALVRHSEIDVVSFTGSVQGGIAIQKAAAERTIPVILELGGKDPAYIRPDVNVASTAADIVDGAVFNSGQSCCALERVYVHESIHDEFIEEIKKVLSGYKVGDPRDKETMLGPLVSKASMERVKAQVEDAVGKGAKVVALEKTFEGMGELGGWFVEPQALVGCTHEMVVMREETFGPLIPIQKVSSDEEAIALMNDSNFGLTACIWSKDVAKAQQLLKKVKSGTAFVNRCDYPAPDLAWTGWKESGKGVTMGWHGWGGAVRVRSWNVKN